MRTGPFLAALSMLVLAPVVGSADEWPYYGRDPGGTRFSPLTGITPANVAGLKPAWTFHTGDIADGKSGSVRSGFETTPLLIDGRLYLTTPFNRVVALDPATGRELWHFDPQIDKSLPVGDGLINRGVAAWRDPASHGGHCALRLYEATLDARLVAIDGADGTPCADFGKAGRVDLRDVERYHAGWYHMTSPPIVVDGVVVVGSSIDDNTRADMPDGVVRGYDARTGRLAWKWQPLIKPKWATSAVWKTGAGNAWTLLSADPERHLVYVPTGSASPDHYGGLRPGDDRWADSVAALDARTGRLAWGFQLVHHDLWDYDTAAAPLLTTLGLHGKTVPVLIAGNKTGMLYALDPASGRPVLPIEERPVPHSTVPGETASPTQPFPATLPSLAPQSLKADQVIGRTDADREACRAALGAMTGSGVFTPPSLKGALIVPGIVGGINWSGFAWDKPREHLIVPVSNLPYRVQLIPAAAFAAGDVLGDFRGETALQTGAPYGLVRAPFRAPSGAFCTPPPWGELISLDLAQGRIVWRRPLGSLDELVPGIGKVAPGSIVLGGPIVTASGLVFIRGTLDRRLRAFSAETGDELWSAELPASAHATPITYEQGGRQYVVIAAGGSAKIDEERQSDAVIAFALP